MQLLFLCAAEDFRDVRKFFAYGICPVLAILNENEEGGVLLITECQRRILGILRNR